MLPHRTLRHRDPSSEPVGYYHRRRTRDGRLQYGVSFQPARGHSSSASSSSFSDRPDNTQIPLSSSQASFQAQENVPVGADIGITDASRTRIPRPDVADIIGTLLGFDTSGVLPANNKPTAPSCSASASNRTGKPRRPEHLSSSEAETSSSGPPRPTPPSGADSVTTRPMSTNRDRTSATRMSRSSSNSDNDVAFTPSRSSSRRARSPGRMFSIFTRRGRRSRTNSDSSSHPGADDIAVGPSVPAYIRNGTGWENMPPTYEYAPSGMTTAGAAYPIANIPAHIYILQPQQPSPTGPVTLTANAPGFSGQPMPSPSVHQTSHGLHQAPGHVLTAVYPTAVHPNVAPPLVSVPASGLVTSLESQTVASAASSENEPAHSTTRAARRASASSRPSRRHHRSDTASSSRRQSSSRGRASNQKENQQHHRDCQDNEQKHRRKAIPDRMQNKHICNGCGRVRSRKFHDANPIRPGRKMIPNFCRKCRDAYLRDEDTGDLADENDSGTALCTKKVKKKKRPMDCLPSDTSFVASIASNIHEIPSPRGLLRTADDSDSEGTLMVQSPRPRQTTSAVSSSIFETSKKFQDAFSAIAEGKARSRSRMDRSARGKKGQAENVNPVSGCGYRPPTVESVIESSEESSAVRSQVPHFSTPPRKRGHRFDSGSGQSFLSPRHFSYPMDDSQSSGSSVNDWSGRTPRQSRFSVCSPVAECRSVLDQYDLELSQKYNGCEEQVLRSTENDPFVDKKKHRLAKQDKRTFEPRQVPGSFHSEWRSPYHVPKTFSVRTASSSTASDNMAASLSRAGEGQDELEAWLSGNKKASSSLHNGPAGSMVGSGIYGDDHAKASPSKEGIPPYNFDLFSEASALPETPVTARMVFGNENETPFREDRIAGPESTIIPDYNFDLFSEVASNWDGRESDGHDCLLDDIGVSVAALSDLDDNANCSPIGSSYFPIGRKGTPEFESYAVTLPSENSSAVDDGSSDLSKRRVLTAVRCDTPGSVRSQMAKTNSSGVSLCPSLEVVEYSEEENENAVGGKVVRHIVECEVVSNPTDSECGHSARLLAVPGTPLQRLLM